MNPTPLDWTQRPLDEYARPAWHPAAPLAQSAVHVPDGPQYRPEPQSASVVHLPPQDRTEHGAAPLSLPPEQPAARAMGHASARAASQGARGREEREDLDPVAVLLVDVASMRPLFAGA